MHDFTGPLVLAQEFPLDPQALLFPLADFIASNLHSEETMTALIRLIRRECDSAPVGGGAQPLHYLSLVSEPCPTHPWPWQIPAPPPASN